MILLIWDSFGKDQLRLYEISLEAEINLVKRCHGHYINEAHGLGSELDESLDFLFELLSNRTQLHSGSGSFGPYTAICYSGFIP